jgi:hypothetical protein
MLITTVCFKSVAVHFNKYLGICVCVHGCWLDRASQTAPHIIRKKVKIKKKMKKVTYQKLKLFEEYSSVLNTKAFNNF